MAHDLETAFEASVGDEGVCVAVLCEYDALPEIGHACGHNIIGTAGLGAGIAASRFASKLGGSLRSSVLQLKAVVEKYSWLIRERLTM